MANQAIELDTSTKLSYDRTRLAYENTMMAWVRTATSLITFGFSVYKFFQFGVKRAEGAARQRGKWVSGLEGIDDFEKREPVKVCIASADLPDSVLTHEDGGMRVVKQVACEVRNFSDDLLSNHRVSLSWDKSTESRRGEEPLDKGPGLPCVPRLSHYSRMGGYAQELIQDRPGDIPAVRPPSLTFEPVAAGSVERRVLVSGVHQDISVDEKHYRPSIAWYRASRSAISTRVPPLRNVGKGERSCCFLCDRNSMRSAVSTSSDIVRPWRAASRFSCAITVSSILSVVFIWKTISRAREYCKTSARERHKS
jgi:hypothetical protein